MSIQIKVLNSKYNKIEKIYNKGNTLNNACKKSGISTNTYYRICDKINRPSIASNSLLSHKRKTKILSNLKEGSVKNQNNNELSLKSKEKKKSRKKQKKSNNTELKIKRQRGGNNYKNKTLMKSNKINKEEKQNGKIVDITGIIDEFENYGESE